MSSIVIVCPQHTHVLSSRTELKMLKTAIMLKPVSVSIADRLFAPEKETARIWHKDLRGYVAEGEPKLMFVWLSGALMVVKPEQYENIEFFKYHHVDGPEMEISDYHWGKIEHAMETLWHSIVHAGKQVVSNGR